MGRDPYNSESRMKNWYFAKCSTCCEIKTFFVSNPSVTAHYLGERDEEIQTWFSKHHGCELTLGWRDDHLDKLWDEGYTNADLR